MREASTAAVRSAADIDHREGQRIVQRPAADVRGCGKLIMHELPLRAQTDLDLIYNLSRSLAYRRLVGLPRIRPKLRQSQRPRILGEGHIETQKLHSVVCAAECSSGAGEATGRALARMGAESSGASQ